MVLIDFTDEEIRHIFQHYPSPHHHPQIWSKLMRAMIPKQEDSIWNLDKDVFEERLQRESKIIAMNMMKNMARPAPTAPATQTYPPTYDAEIGNIWSQMGAVLERLERLEAQIAALVNKMNRQ